MNHRTGKLNIFADYSAIYNYNWYYLGNGRIVMNNGLSTQTNSLTSRSFINNNHNPKLGFDYNLSRKTIIGVIVSGFYNNLESDAHADIKIQEELKQTTLIKQHTLEKSL